MTQIAAPSPTAEPVVLSMRPLVARARYGTESAEAQFRSLYQDESAPATVTVLRNAGLDRHLAIRVPGTGMYWIDIVTWSGTLAIRSDWGSWMFSRTEDMLEFFDGRYVNMGYWTEKCVTHHPDDLPVFDEDKFRATVLDKFWSWSRRTEMSSRDITLAWGVVREELLGDYASVYTVDQAINACYEVNRAAGAEVFSEPYDYDLTDYPNQVKVALHAVLWVAQNRDLLTEEA
ncbi:hypothetical protein LG293_15935 (plasmid) [Citricoccus nitrophenolicus]